jgi:hypothetical protein
VLGAEGSTDGVDVRCGDGGGDHGGVLEDDVRIKGSVRVGT